MDRVSELLAATSRQAVDSMRSEFTRAFGRSWVGRRLAGAAWPTFRAALVHGLGIDAAAELATLVAKERNKQTMLAVRWPASRIDAVIATATRQLATAG